MRFTQAATDFYKNVRKEAEATGAIPKPKAKPKPKQEVYTITVQINGEEYELDLATTGGAPTQDAMVRAADAFSRKMMYDADSGDGKYRGGTPLPMGTPKPQPKTTGIGPQFPAQRGAEIGAMGAGASRAVSVEEINARELQNTPTEKLVEELLRGPNQKTSAKQERYRAVLDELQNRATTAGANTKLGPLLGPMGMLNMKGVTDAGHLAGLVSGSILEPFETGASLGKASSGADLDIRDRINIIGATPQAGAALGAIGKAALEKGGELAARRAAKTGITPPVGPRIVDANAPRVPTPEAPLIGQQTGPFKPKPTSVLDEVLGGARVTMNDIENAGGTGVTLVRSSGGANVNFHAQVKRGGPLAVKLSRNIDQGKLISLSPEQSRQLAELENLPGREGYDAVATWWDAPEQNAVRSQIMAELDRHRAIGNRMEQLYRDASSGKISPDEYQSGIKSALDELAGKQTGGAPTQAKPAVEPMPAPVAMAETSPVRGSVGETVPRAESGIFDSATWTKERTERINASRKAGNTHLDSIPAYVDTMRGLPVQNVHDANVRGRVYTVDNEGRVFIEWLDEHSQRVEMARPMQIGTGKKKRQAMVSWLGPRDLQDYIAGTAKPFDAPTVSPKPATSTPTAPTSARYGANYGTPQPGQGQRVGYARSVLDEVLGNAPAVDANRAKEPWEMTRENAVDRTWPPGKDVPDAPDGAETEFNGMKAVKRGGWIYEGYTMDGSQRRTWYPVTDPRTAKRLDHQVAVETALREGKPVPAEVLADYPDLAAKYGKTAEQNAPVKPPTSPVETPQPVTATVEPPAQTVTPTTDPTTPTSARQATGLANVVQDAEADAGMIASSPRATGTKRGEAQAKGKAAVESGQIDPETLAAEIASGKRTFKDETEVGALKEGKRRILDRINKLGKAIDEAHARGEDATTLIAKREQERANLTTYLENIQQGKGKWSDVGRALQEGTTIDEGVYEDVLAEFRRNKPDGKVSKREEDAIKDLVDQHNATKEQLAKVESELAQLKAAEGAQVIARKGTVGRRTVTQIRAERDLVSASISKSIREAIGGPIGIGGGGLENLFEVVPQLARDLRKLIELYIEEFKVGKLDSEFYVGAKQVIRDALADVPDEVLDDLKVDLKNLSDDEVNRIFGGIYDVKQSRTKSEVQARIADLKKQAELLAKIEGAKEGEVLKAGTPPPPASPKVRELRAQLNELLKGLGADPSMDGVRTRLNNILDDLNKQSQGKYRNIKDNKTRVSPPDIQRIREQIASVRRDMRLEDTLADLEEQLATGNYKTPNKKVAALTAEQEKLKARVDMRRSQVRAAIEKAKPKNIADLAVGALNVPRTLKASVDISAPGRQGWILGIANPKAAKNAFIDQMKALGTEEGAVMAQNAIMNRPNVGLYKKADLYLAPVDGALNAKEEAFLGAEMLGAWKKYNPVRASDRAYAAYLNRLRADVFDNMVKGLGLNPTDEQLREVARYINVASGRGDVGLKGSSQIGKQIAQGMPAAAMVFWSPRNMISRIQFATGVPLATAARVPGARKLIAKEYAKSIIATGAVIGIGKMAVESELAKDNKLGGTVSGDITNSDFGKIRSGDTRIDVLAGVQQPLVLIGRLITGKSTSPVSGNVTDLKNPGFGQPGPGDIIWRFAKSKMNPIFGSAEEFYTGKDFVGQPVSKGESVANVFVPLSVKEIYEALTEEGIEKEDAYALLNIFGISTARFKDKEKQQN